MNDRDSKTDDWVLYEAGITYNQSLTPAYDDMAERNEHFYRGDQWFSSEQNEDVDELPKPVFNFLKRFILFMVSQLTSQKQNIRFNPYIETAKQQDENGIDIPTISDYLNTHTDFLMEKFKMEFKTKSALIDTATYGDVAAHLWFDPSIKPYGGQSGEYEGEICLELVDGISVFFGNANTKIVDNQPYIIISGRDTVQSLKAEAEMYGDKDSDPESIVPDSDTVNQIGGRSNTNREMDSGNSEFGQATFIIVYKKDPKTGIISVSKSTRTSYIFKDIETGLTQYPIAWLQWEEIKNQFHGNSFISSHIATQIFINKMVSMIFYHLMRSAFPKVVYNSALLPNGWNNSLTEAIGYEDQGTGLDASQVAQYLNPANMSPQIVEALNLVIGFMKETMGISDAALGQIDKPQNTSAIIATQKAAAIPLQIVRANLNEWLEDIGKILLDMMAVYYDTRPVLMEINGQKVLQEFDFSSIKDTWLNVKCDISESSPWNEDAIVETLNNLLQGAHIDFVQFLERLPDSIPLPEKQKLIDEVKAKIEAEKAAIQAKNQPIPQNPEQPQPQQPNVDAILSQLSPEEQQQFMSASPEVQQQLLAHATGT